MGPSRYRAEVYGCLIYHNGWQGPDGAHGHGICSQNETGSKLFRDNIIFNQFDKGIQIFGSDAAELKNFHLEGNTIFNNGILASNRELSANITIYGGATGPQGIVVLDNLCYGTGFEGKLMIGGQSAKDLVFQRNDVPHLARFRYWQTANVTGNTFVRPATMLELYTTVNPLDLAYVWNDNTYFGQPLKYSPFAIWMPCSVPARTSRSETLKIISANPC